MLTHVELKDPKKENSKNTLQNAGYFEGRRPILGLCWPILGLCWPMLAHLAAMLAYLDGNLGPSWGYVGPSWGYVGPSWGLRCPRLRLCWPILRPMLSHVDPSGATSSEKGGKMGRARNTVKRSVFGGT